MSTNWHFWRLLKMQTNSCIFVNKHHKNFLLGYFFIPYVYLNFDRKKNLEVHGMSRYLRHLQLNPFFSEILNSDSLLIAFFLSENSAMFGLFFGLVAIKVKLFCLFSIKSKQGTSKEVIIEVKQKFFKKLSVIYCWNECRIQCWKKRDTHFNTQFNKFGYSMQNVPNLFVQF